MNEKIITLYGIKSCDSVRKARKFLDNAEAAYHYHDFRVDGLTLDKLETWVAQAGWEKLLNTRSTSWRQLSDDDKSGLNGQSAVQLMHANPTLIKRPVTECNEQLFVGYKEAEFQENLL